MRFFSKQTFVLAALACSVLATGIPGADSNTQDVSVAPAQRVHIREFSVLEARDKAVSWYIFNQIDSKHIDFNHIDSHFLGSLLTHYTVGLR